MNRFTFCKLEPPAPPSSSFPKKKITPSRPSFVPQREKEKGRERERETFRIKLLVGCALGERGRERCRVIGVLKKKKKKEKKR